MFSTPATYLAPTSTLHEYSLPTGIPQDKELNRRIGLATMTFGKLKCMVFTSKKVSLRVKNNVYSAMVLSVLLHGAAESWALSRNQLSRLETLLRSEWPFIIIIINCLG